MTTTFVRSAALMLCTLSLLPALACAGNGPDTRPASVDFRTCPKPDWPKEALEKGQHGTVKLAFDVGADGLVRQSRVVATSFHPLLDKAARLSIAKCRLQPALESGKPVPATLTLQYVWSLEGEQSKPLANAPAHLAEFFRQARAADAIVDRYQRCLAFPDFPGNAWPAGLGKQYCDITAGAHVTGQDLERMLEQNQLTELDALFRRDLARHFAAGDFSEVIHNDFFIFEHSGERADRVSLDWIEKAPESPFANAARGFYLYHAAAKARGGKWINETPLENLHRMNDYAVMAVKFFEKALRLEPRLMPAYTGLIKVGNMDSESADDERAFARGAAIDAGCRQLGRERMRSLQPRWGGSYQAMTAYGRELEAMVPARTLVALNLGLPQLDMADGYWRDKQYANMIKVLEPAARISPFSDVFAQLGVYLPQAGGDKWEALVRLLTAYRYNDDVALAAEMRGTLLLDLGGDADWAVASLRRAVSLDPDNLRARFALGRALMVLSEQRGAESAFTAALASPALADEAAYALIMLAAEQGRMLRVGQLSTDFIAKYPEQPRGHYMRAVAHMRTGEEGAATAAFSTFVDLAAKQKVDMPEQLALARRYIAGERDLAPAKNAPKL